MTLDANALRLLTKGSADDAWRTILKEAVSIASRPLAAGNAPSEVVRGPGVTNFDATLFKNFPIKSEQRMIQLRWELYNMFNHTQFSGVNTAATFNAAGVQTNTAFGQASSARAARIMQVSLRFKF